MGRGVVWLVVLGGLAVLAPGVSAQSAGQVFGATDHCTKACDLDGLTRNGWSPQGSVWVMLYGHVQEPGNLGERSVLNTQRPDPVHEPDRSVSQKMACADSRTGTPADVHFLCSEFVFFTSPGLVEYLDVAWRTQQEQGAAFPVRLVGDKITLHLALTVNGTAPNVGVYARLDSGRFPFHGDLIAESDPSAAASRRTMVGLPGDPFYAYEFEVPLTIKSHEISKKGAVLYVRILQVDSNSASFLQPGVSLRVGSKFPPRLAFQIENPLRTHGASLEISGSDLLVRWSLGSPWGDYDVQDKTFGITSTGAVPLDAQNLRLLLVKRNVDWGGQLRPLNVSWAYDFGTHRLADGSYELTAHVRNGQDTFRLEHSFPFQVRDGRPFVVRIGSANAIDVPGLGAAPTIVAIAAMFLALRRRRTEPL
jgi:hypothetical protein